MNPLRSVGARLGLGLAIVVAAALGLVHLIVVPSLKQNLIDAKLDQLREAVPLVARDLILSDLSSLDDTLQSAAASTDARVVYFTRLSRKRLIVFADSNPLTAADVQGDPIALRAHLRSDLETGTIKSGGKRFAEAAYSVAGEYVILLRAPLRDTLQTVDLVRRRLLIAGLIALAAALAVGYLAATVFARRIRRLERSVDRIAGGDFEEPIADTGKDELGQLAVTFDRMRQQLAQLEHARREFIANASHELRTPLFSLGGFLELMADEELDPKTRTEFMATMREQVDRLTKLATDLLDLSRLDAGRLSVERELVDLAVVAEALVDEFRAIATSSGHDLAADGVAPEATALGDEERARQIGRILVENALVHTPPGTPVRLATARRNGSVLLTVEDEGPGIPPEHAGRIFDRFYRIEGSVASGSGLGLAIARELAELMGGSVELHLIPGRTIFALVLPTASEGVQNGQIFSRENAVTSGTSA
jgi:signal transduction histidine kinase